MARHWRYLDLVEISSCRRKRLQRPFSIIIQNNVCRSMLNDVFTGYFIYFSYNFRCNIRLLMDVVWQYSNKGTLLTLNASFKALALLKFRMFHIFLKVNFSSFPFRTTANQNSLFTLRTNKAFVYITVCTPPSNPVSNNGSAKDLSLFNPAYHLPCNTGEQRTQAWM